MLEYVPQNVQKIVVLRANGLGDYIFALPALEALRQRYPDASISYVGLPWHAAELAHRPGPVDRYITSPLWPGVSAPDTEPLTPEHGQAAEPFFKKMRAERFDLGVQLHGGGLTSNAFLAAMRPRFTVGTRATGAPPLDRSLPYDYYQHEVLRWLAVAELADARPASIEPRWEPTSAETLRSHDLLPADGRPLVIVNAGAGAGRRRWSPGHFAAVADRLAEQGARVVVVGSRADAEVAAQVQACAATRIESVAGGTDIGELAALLARASVVVSNDSGPLHLARAVQTPTVGIYWFGNVINAGPLSVSRNRTAMSWRTECPECGTDCTSQTCGHDSSFVDDVPPAEVIAKAEDLLSRYGRVDALLAPARVHGIPNGV